MFDRYETSTVIIIIINNHFILYECPCLIELITIVYFLLCYTQNRRKLYAPVLSQLRYIVIGRMAKPEEVLVVENDQGEVVREFMKDTDSMTLYKNMRECLG